MGRQSHQRSGTTVCELYDPSNCANCVWVFPLCTILCDLHLHKRLKGLPLH